MSFEVLKTPSPETLSSESHEVWIMDWTEQWFTLSRRPSDGNHDPVRVQTLPGSVTRRLVSVGEFHNLYIAGTGALWVTGSSCFHWSWATLEKGVLTPQARLFDSVIAHILVHPRDHSCKLWGNLSIRYTMIYQFIGTGYTTITRFVGIPRVSGVFRYTCCSFQESLHVGPDGYQCTHQNVACIADTSLTRKWS